MNDRQFAAAHDRYLDPPDDEEERPDCEDEDRAYEQMKQRRIDEERAQGCRFGGVACAGGRKRLRHRHRHLRDAVLGRYE